MHHVLPRRELKAVLAAGCAAMFGYAAVLLVGPALYPVLADALDVPLERMGWLATASMAGFVAGVVAVGGLTDRKGKLPVALAGELLLAAGAFSFAATSSFAVGVAAAFLAGVGGGLAEPATMALMADVAAPGRGSAVANFSQAFFSAGAVAAPAAAGLSVSAGWGWRPPFVAAGASAVVAAILCARAMRRTRPSQAPAATDGHAPHDPPPVPAGAWRTVTLVGVAGFLYVAGEGGASSWVSSFLERDLGASPGLAATGLAVMWLGLLAGRLAAAGPGARLRPDRVLAVAFVLSMLGQALVLAATTPAAALAAVFLHGAALGPIFPVLIVLAVRAAPLASGRVTAAVVALGAAGGAVAPPLLGALASGFGMRAALWACVGFLGAGLAAGIAAARLGSDRFSASGPRRGQ